MQSDVKAHHCTTSPNAIDGLETDEFEYSEIRIKYVINFYKK